MIYGDYDRLEKYEMLEALKKSSGSKGTNSFQVGGVRQLWDVYFFEGWKANKSKDG